VAHDIFRHLENFITGQYSGLGIKHIAEDEFTIGEGERTLTVKCEPGDVIFFRTAFGTPNGYFRIEKTPGGPKLFLNTLPEPMHTDQAAEHLVKLVTD
jgi:hypothetical protein